VILQALTRYYETLLKAGEIAPRYFVKTGVSFGLQLREDGSLSEIVPLKISVERGKKTVDVPQPKQVPEQFVKAGTKPPSNFLCDNAAFLMGLDTRDKPEQARQYFETAKTFHLSILERDKGREAGIIRSYFETWHPERVSELEIAPQYYDDLAKGAQLIFILPDGRFAQDISSIQIAWVEYKKSTQSENCMQCLVTGEKEMPICSVHPKIKGVRGGQMAGTSLVSFNAPAYWSYGHDNAPVSEYAAFAYTSALNHLIADFEHRMPLDGDTLVCWAEDGEVKYQDTFMECVNPRYNTENEVSQTLRHIVKCGAVDIEALDVDTPFYVLCLSPNAARVSVRFFLCDSFGNIAENLAKHYRRLEIAKGPKEKEYLAPYWMLKETAPPGSKDDASSPLLAGATLRAILSGGDYPAALYENILLRIRADRNVNRARAATIKAYLTKNILHSHPEYKEVLQMALNEQSELKPYVLGRLFSLLEQAQESANPGIKATITDRYFDSACATPKLAFPTLLKLNRHHLAKDEKWGWRYERQIGELADKLNADDDPYPARMTLEEQGLFILGYYHQKQARYTKKSESEKENA
jgi:CRISPR-associated protein Csd1